jgi:hypothetical protein
MINHLENFLGVEFTLTYIISQIIGFVALGFIAYSYQKKTQGKILRLQFIAGMLFFVSMMVQGAYTGAVLNIIGAGRSFVYSRCSEKKWANNILFPIFFLIAFTISTIFTWERWYSLLPLAAMLITTIAYRSTNATFVRAISLPCSICWMIYGIIIGNVSGLSTEIFVSSSIIIGLIRYDLPKLKKKKCGAVTQTK